MWVSQGQLPLILKLELLESSRLNSVLMHTISQIMYLNKVYVLKKHLLFEKKLHRQRTFVKRFKGFKVT